MTQPQIQNSAQLLPDAPGQTAPANPAAPSPAAAAEPRPPQRPCDACHSARATSATDQEPEQAAPGDEEGTYTLKTNVNEVNLTFTVTDHHGHFINNLQQQDFALLDDQRAPAQVYSFTQQTNQPLRVGLVIDASTSIRARFKFEQQAATEFLLNILRPRTDRAFIMGFDVTSYVTQGFTNNPDLLETGLNRLKPGGGTAMYDAVYKACRDQMLKAFPQMPRCARRSSWFRTGTTTRAAPISMKRSRCASARRPPSSPSAPTPAPRASAATMC